MTTGNRREGTVWLAGGLTTLAYAWLAWSAAAPDARVWLGLVHVVAWLAVGVVAWRGRETRRTWWVIVAELGG